MEADVSEDLKPNEPTQETAVSRREFGAVSLAAGLAVVAGAGAAEAAERPLTETEVTVQTPDGNCDAAFIHPTTGTFPGVLIWPDAFGLRPAMRQIARRIACENDPGLVPALKRLVEPATLGDPMRPLIWVSKSMEKLAATLTQMGHPIRADTVCTELVKLGFSRQSNRKANKGSKHPDRDAQFEYINAKVVAAQAQQQPVISVDTKKKELIGNFKNGGTDYRPKGNPQRVNVHDFEDKKLGKVVPYGVYDVTPNTGFVSVGITSDTAEFAVQSIRCWLERMGRQRYPDARELTVTADCGGSNGARVRLWKLERQKLADETGLVIRVHHYPPGTSKWNKIEHRLFCHIPQNWRGRALPNPLSVVELIGATTTKTGLKVESALDTRSYQKGIKVSKAAMKCLDITGDQFHPEWNYTIRSE